MAMKLVLKFLKWRGDFQWFWTLVKVSNAERLFPRPWPWWRPKFSSDEGPGEWCPGADMWLDSQHVFDKSALFATHGAYARRGRGGHFFPKILLLNQMRISMKIYLLDTILKMEEIPLGFDILSAAVWQFSSGVVAFLAAACQHYHRHLQTSMWFFP